jgi:4-amino-4-deoxy-L-arabinose transferase-like glycosyltransferase
LLAGYLLIAFFFVTRLVYLASGRIELTEDEAYQWLWSKHLALSYYSKPPLIAYAQFIGTSLWGDNEFGVRFMAPVLATALSVAMLRFMAREVSARAGFWLILILAATPLMALGSTLLTVDALSVFFWMAALISGWRALNSADETAPGSTGLGNWVWTGLFLGLGLMSKYTAIFQIIGFAVFFLLWPAARQKLRTAGPFLALGIAVLAFLPVLIWNAQHHWITVTHLSERGGLEDTWRFRPQLIAEFLLFEFGLLNPIFFIGMIWAVVSVLRHRPWRALHIYLFCMGAPVFLFYLAYTIRARVLPNWIAPGVVPLFALMVAFWHARWQTGAARVKGWLVTGLALGLTVVGVLHGTEVLAMVIGRNIPPKLDPLHRVRGWKEIAAMLERERQQLVAQGKPVFLITQHYGLTSILSFYIPEAKKMVRTDPFVYYIRTERPRNQFYFWMGYQNRSGQNALYVREADRPAPPPAELLRDFDSVTDLGMRAAFYHGEPFRHFQLYFCRNLH